VGVTDPTTRESSQFSVSQTLNVLHVSPYFHPAAVYGGAVEAVFNLCVSTAELGHAVRVITTNANGPSNILSVDPRLDIELRDRLHVRYLARVGRHSLAPSLLAPLVAGVAAADVVHLTAVYSFPSLPTLLCCKAFKKPLIWSPHGSLQRWSGSTRVRVKAAWEQACRLVAPSRLRLHVTSQEEADDSTVRLPWLRTNVIPNGVEVPLKIKRETGDGRLRLVYLGRLHQIKALDHLIDACGLLNSGTDPSWTLAIAGSGETDYVRELHARTDRAGLSQRVRFVGEVAGPHKDELLANADVLVLPSHVENFGIVVAEALARGVPVIASQGTPWSRLETVGCGLWVNNNPASLAVAIRRISQMPLIDMGQSGREWMQREFGWNTIAGRMVHLYREVIGLGGANVG
jgi:glycosyltransferase involved in cell wall biosynthesis